MTCFKRKNFIRRDEIKNVFSGLGMRIYLLTLSTGFCLEIAFKIRRQCDKWLTYIRRVFAKEFYLLTNFLSTRTLPLSTFFTGTYYIAGGVGRRYGRCSQQQSRLCTCFEGSRYDRQSFVDVLCTEVNQTQKS